MAVLTGTDPTPRKESSKTADLSRREMAVSACGAFQLAGTALGGSQSGKVGCQPDQIFGQISITDNAEKKQF